MSMRAMLPIPADFRAALSRAGLDEFFIECAYVHRAGYLSWIAASGRPETRHARIQRAIARLRAQQDEELDHARNRLPRPSIEAAASSRERPELLRRSA